MSPERYEIHIDLKPGLNFEQLICGFRGIFRNSKTGILVILCRSFCLKLIPVAVNLSGIPGEKKCHQISRQERMNFGRLLKSLPVTISGFRHIEEAIVTAGGVSVHELSPNTMESKLVKGLFFAGEVLDVDGYTGGFNLQIAFSTGYLAGNSIWG
ncbi:MAG: NAD(P)/FAD-dependent oxidoreductase [[Clostridium] leptum]